MGEKRICLKVRWDLNGEGKRRLNLPSRGERDKVWEERNAWIFGAIQAGREKVRWSPTERRKAGWLNTARIVQEKLTDAVSHRALSNEE